MNRALIVIVIATEIEIVLGIGIKTDINDMLSVVVVSKKNGTHFPTRNAHTFKLRTSKGT